MAAVNAPAGQGNAFAMYRHLDWKQQLAGGAGLLAFSADYLFRKDAYKGLYTNLQPPIIKGEVATAAGGLLGAEALIVALFVSAVVYKLLDCLSPGRARPH